MEKILARRAAPLLCAVVPAILTLSTASAQEPADAQQAQAQARDLAQKAQELAQQAQEAAAQAQAAAQRAQVLAGGVPAPEVTTAPSPMPPRPRPIPPLAPREPGEENNAARPLLSFGNDAYFVKPVLAMAGGISLDKIMASANANQEDRVTTVAITRFGFEGRLGPYVSFRSEFERNIGAHGSGVWEGTASFSVRDQFIRLQRWGITLDGGIILDQASVDFFSAHTADLLLADHFTRDPLLYSGFNRGQGLKAMYSRWGLTLGFAYTEGNPLSTSTSFQVGGTFGGGSRFWERPLSGFRIGQPDDSFHFRLLSPSLTFARRWDRGAAFFGVEAKTMGQVFWVDYDTNNKDAPKLFGYNVRGNLQLRFGGRARSVGTWAIVPFGNVSYETNQVLNPTAGMANTLLDTWYQSLTFSAGLDLFFFGRSGIGFSYGQVAFDSPSYVAATGTTPAMEPVTHTAQSYLNVGLTYWLTEYVALGARVAYLTVVQTGVPDEDRLGFFATMRMVL